MSYINTEILISVIIPCYNSESFIIDALESVKAQSYSNLEIIIINDGSTDNTKDIVMGFIASNARLNIILIDQLNKGVSAARNAGLRAASGDWIALLDSDDKWLSKKLEKQMAIVTSNPNVDFLGTNRNGEIFDQFIYKKIEALTQIYPRDLFYKMFFFTSTVIFKKEILNTIGYFDEKISFCEDAKFFIQICRRYNCFLLKESLVIAGGGRADYLKNGLSGNLWKMQKGELNNINEGFKTGLINIFEYVFIWAFSNIKYCRRLLLVVFS